MYERSIIKVKISLWNPNCISILYCWLSHFSVMCANLEVNIKPCKFDIKYITYLWYLSTLLNCHLIFYAIFNYHKCKAIKKVIKKCMFLCAIFKSGSSKICTGQMIILQMNSNKYNYDKTSSLFNTANAIYFIIRVCSHFQLFKAFKNFQTWST